MIPDSVEKWGLDRAENQENTTETRRHRELDGWESHDRDPSQKHTSAGYSGMMWIICIVFAVTLHARHSRMILAGIWLSEVVGSGRSPTEAFGDEDLA